MKLEGRGSIEQLEKNKPRGKCRKWRLWVRSEGKNRSRRFNGTYREAQAALDAFKAEMEAVVPNSDTFASYAALWWRLRADSGSFSINTTSKDSCRVRALSLVLGDKAMDSITPEMCRDALSRIKNGENSTGRVLTNTTMDGMFVCLKQIMQQAEDDGRITRNPMARMKAPKRDTKERSALTPGEMGILLDRLDGLPCDGRVMAVYLIACLGLRRAEACALMDEDVRDGFAHVRYAVKEADGSIGRPKSAAGNRMLPMPGRLQRKVDEWRLIREENGYGDAPTLACDTRGGVLLPQSLYRWWHGNHCHNAKRDELGCPGMVLHELRHSNLTMMARHMSPFDLQRYAGWSSLEPAKVYIHDDMESVVRGVDEAWDGI
ncbi:MAG: tyrosine-type recombinase/integrase [Atopobiaceae bacterium]|nr:tyrosine-type recombinase/integrase [Atopobiaceae bacterium]